MTGFTVNLEELEKCESMLGELSYELACLCKTLSDTRKQLDQDIRCRDQIDDTFKALLGFIDEQERETCQASRYLKRIIQSYKQADSSNDFIFGGLGNVLSLQPLVYGIMEMGNSFIKGVSGALQGMDTFLVASNPVIDNESPFPEKESETSYYEILLEYRKLEEQIKSKGGNISREEAIRYISLRNQMDSIPHYQRLLDLNNFYVRLEKFQSELAEKGYVSIEDAKRLGELKARLGYMTFYERILGARNLEKMLAEKGSSISEEDIRMVNELKNRFPDEFKMVDSQIDIMAEKIEEWRVAFGKPCDENTKKVIDAQIYLTLLNEGCIGSIGPYCNGVDGSYGDMTRKALYEFEQAHDDVPDTIIKIVKGDQVYYEGEISEQTLQKLKEYANPIAEQKDKLWIDRLSSSESLLTINWDKVANPFYYIDWQKGATDPDCFDQIDPVFESRLAALARDKYHNLILIEGLRDIDRQKYFWDRWYHYLVICSKNITEYRKKYPGENAPNLAAYPGLGRHNYGIAIDTSSYWLKDLYGDKAATYNQKDLVEYGLHKSVTSGNGSGNPENWHIEPKETYDFVAEGNKSITELVGFYYAYRYCPLSKELLNTVTSKISTVYDVKGGNSKIRAEKRVETGIIADPDILLLQACLKKAGYDLGAYCGDGINGKPTTETLAALKKYMDQPGEVTDQECRDLIDILIKANITSRFAE